LWLHGQAEVHSRGKVMVSCTQAQSKTKNTGLR
jgi:hypothetical protein